MTRHNGLGIGVFLLLVLFGLTSVNAETTKISIVGHGTRSSKIVDLNASSLTIGASEGGVGRLVRIEGLLKLKALKTLTLYAVELDADTDIQFFAEAKQIEVLRLGNVRVASFAFLKFLPNLTSVIDFDIVRVTDQLDTIDLSGNPNLIRLDVGTAIFGRVPTVLSPPGSLQFLNLASSKIKDLSNLSNLATGPFVVILGEDELRRAGKSTRFVTNWAGSGLKVEN